jgi:rhodanese-related sulfurtransferase
VVDWSVVWGDFLTNLPADMYAVGAAALNTALVEAPPFLLDIREPAELEEGGYISGAVNIPTRAVLDNLDKLPAQDQPIVVYCASGHRGSLITAALQMLGYTNARNLGGGIGAWKKAEFTLEAPGLPETPAAGTAPAVDALRLDKLKAYVAGLPEGWSTIKAPDLNLALGEAEVPFVLDLRTAEELASDGYIEGAVNIPVTELWSRLSELPQDKAAKIVVLCKSGHRGGFAMMALQMNGYTDVVNLAGGMGAWAAAELAVVK